MKTGKREKTERVEAEAISYFFWHNLFSVFIFFLMTMQFGLFKERNYSFSYIFSIDFGLFVIIIFCFSLLAGFIGRLTAYIVLKAYFSWRNKRNRKIKVMKKFGELNSGINKISIAFFISAFITAVVFSLGVVLLLQNMLFDENTLLTLMATYLLLKIGIFFGIKLLVEWKL